MRFVFFAFFCCYPLVSILMIDAGNEFLLDVDSWMAVVFLRILGLQLSTTISWCFRFLLQIPDLLLE